MKIRIEGSSVRLRLRRSEVERLSRGETIVESTGFSEGKFSYSLGLSTSGTDLRAELKPYGIAVFLPDAWGKEWAGNSRVGFQSSQELPDGASLHLLVEKDFVCLDRHPDAQRDQYPNPKSEACEE